MSTRSLLALGLLLCIIALERLAHFSLQPSLALDLLAQGASSADVGRTMMVIQGAGAAGVLVGGAVAYAVGPRVAIAAGISIAALGHFGLAGGAPITVGAGVVAFGAGVSRPCSIVVAAELLAWDGSDWTPAPHRFIAVVAFTLACTAVANIGGFFGPIAAGILRQFDPTLKNAIDGGVMLVAAALAAAALFLLSSKDRDLLSSKDRDKGGEVRIADPYRRPPPLAPVRPAPHALSLASVALLAGPNLAYGAGASAVTPPFDLIRRTNNVWMFVVQAGAVAITSLVMLVLLSIAVRERTTRTPLFLYGIGAIIFAIGLVPADAGSASLELYAAGSVIQGVGAVFLMAVPMAYAALLVRGRAATFVVVGWFAISAVPSMLTGILVALDVPRSLLIWTSAALTLVAGVALVAFGRQWHHKYFTVAPETAPESPAESAL